MELTRGQSRVVGSLAEKALTTPQHYPLTLNALVSACNQSSNRDPIVNYGESEVEGVLLELKDLHLVRFVHPSHGRSVVRYRQVLDELLGLDARRLSLLAVLLLRGPQTLGELRIRTERMAEFDGLGAVEHDLEALAQGEEPLVARLPRRPGQKEERWSQLLAEEPDRGPEGAGESRGSRSGGATEELREELAELRAELAELRAEVAELRDSLGG